MNLRRIFIVDDDNDIRAIVRMALEFTGDFEIDECDNGRDAVRLITEKKPDLVLLDVMMPDMDGRAVLSALRADPATADIPVIFLTARVQPSDIDDLQGQGAMGVIGKPFDPMTLSTEILAIWRSRPHVKE